MRRILQISILVACIFSTMQLDAQRRYLDEVFEDVEVSTPDFAGTNFTVLPWIFAAAQGMQGNTLRQPLVYQMYQPSGDTETARPLVLYIHTGNFFPFPQNGSCGGTITDSTAVEICTRLAKMGYAVASIDYRQGWLPTHPEELVRRFSLINAAYRGVQDVNTFIRFFRMTAEDQGNPFSIDPEKIVVWGQGTGGYLSLASAYLNEYTEILTTTDPNKFLLPLPDGSTVPMVIENYNGDLNAELPGAQFNDGEPRIVDATYNALSQLPIGDTLTVANHVGYSNDFHLAVNMGGALGDSTWVSEGEVPLVSFHSVTDAFAPYTTDVLLVPTANGPQPVVEVSGSYDVQKTLAGTTNNDVFNTIPVEFDPIGQAHNGDFNGLYSFVNTPDDTGAPWEWTEDGTQLPQAQGCNFDPAQALTYIDTIMAYYAPRGCAALGLDCFTTSTDDVLQNDLFSTSPNPTTGEINVQAIETAFTNVSIFDLSGRVVLTQNSLTQRNQATLDVSPLSSGIYIMKVQFENGIATRKIIKE